MKRPPECCFKAAQSELGNVLKGCTVDGPDGAKPFDPSGCDQVVGKALAGHSPNQGNVR